MIVYYRDYSSYRGYRGYSDLLIRSHAEAVNLFFGKVAPVATTEIFLGETGKLNAVELKDLVAEALEDASHDAILTGVNLNAYLLLIDSVSILDVVSLDFPVLELHALGNVLQVVSSNVLVKIDMINLLLEELRVGEFRCQVAVVSKQEHTRCVAVETTHGVYTLRAGTLDEVHDSLALLRVVTGGDVVLRLVEQDIDFLLEGDGLVVEHNAVGTQHLGAEFGHYIAIDRHHAGLDELVSLTTTAHSGISQKLVQTDRLVGVVVFLLVLNALLHAVLGTGVVVSCTRTESARTTLLAITATLLSITATGLTVAAALLTIATLVLTVAGLVTTLLGALSVAATWLVATFIIIVTGTIAATLLVVAASLLITIVTGLIATTLLVTAMLLIAAIVLTIAGTIGALGCTTLQGSTEPFGTEAALVVLMVVITATLLSVGRTRFLNARSWCTAYRTIALIAVLV